MVENAKESIATSPLRRNKAIKVTEKAIEALKKDPEAQKNREVIKKIYDSLTFFGLTHASYRKTISIESVQSFYDIVKSIGSEESQKMIEQLEKEMYIHPENFKKREAEKLAAERQQLEPGE